MSRNVMVFTVIAVAAGVAAMPACRRAQTKEDKLEDEASEKKTVEAIRRRGAFDLGCAEAEVTVVKIQDGSMWSPATYGAKCGDKRATYLQRMDTIMRQ